MRIVVAQKGAREHFLVARALHRHGMLAGLVTDWYAPQSDVARGLLRILGRRRAASARAAECVEIPRKMVRAFPFRSLFWKWRVRGWGAQGRVYEAFAQTDAAFARAAARCALPPHEVFFGYAYASLEALEEEKKRGIVTVLGQIDPGPTHVRIVAEEMRLHPELAGPAPIFPERYFARVRREWELADIIVVNSEWSRESIIAEGADRSKIEILPLAYEAGGEKKQFASGHDSLPLEVNVSTVNNVRPLVVLWLGQVNAGKGIHCLVEAAKLLANEFVQFDVVGPVGILPRAAACAPRNMTFHGCISRDKVAQWYRQSDVFVLPTLSDGFALTQLEAMAHGLPVITTPNCGRVVEAGKTGFIVPSRDPQALAAALRRFVVNRDLAREMAPACRTAAQKFSVNTYGRQLVEILETHLGWRTRSRR